METFVRYGLRFLTVRTYNGMARKTKKCPFPDEPESTILGALIHKFGNVFSVQATSWSRGRPGVFIRRRRSSRSLRVNFHSNGLAKASQ